MNPVLYVWKTSSRSLPWVLIQMAINPFQFRRFPGVTFAKSLGTGRGISFTPTDADLNQWSALLVFSDENSANNFDNSKFVKKWNRHSTEQLRVILQPISSHGLWAKNKPFGEPTPIKWDGKVAAITRARIKWWMNLQFWRAVPPVTQDLHNQPGLLQQSELERHQSASKALFRFGVMARPCGALPMRAAPIRAPLPKQQS